MIALLIKASVILAIVWGFYKIFLEKESFFAANRMYLTGCLVLIFALPFVSLPKLLDEQGFVSAIIENADHPPASTTVPESASVENIAADPDVQVNSIVGKPASQWTVWLLWLYYFGVVIFFMNLVFQILSVLMKVVKATDKVRDRDVTIVNYRNDDEPCSFFNYIFINPGRYDNDTYEQILAHEKVHVRNLHSVDLLLAEIAVILLWFNPLVWIFRREVEKNIEYQTDDQLLRAKTVEKERYQMNLLKVATYKKPLTVTTNYNQSLIRQRILRMGAKRSNQQGYWKYAFVAPMLFVLVLSMNKPFTALAGNAGDRRAAVKEGGESGALFSGGCQSLLRAVKDDDLAKVKELLQTVDPDCSYRGDGEPRSPLVAAARAGNLSIGKLLIEAGADVEYHASGDETPLMAAAWRGKLDVVKYLVDKGAVVNKKLGGNGTALLVASRHGHLPTVQYLISKGADVNGRVTGDGTPLICAVRNGHYEIAKILLEHGADPYLDSPGDEYPMYHARISKNEAMIELLKKY